jgi:hypothetical protein
MAIEEGRGGVGWAEGAEESGEATHAERREEARKKALRGSCNRPITRQVAR